MAYQLSFRGLRVGGRTLTLVLLGLFILFSALVVVSISTLTLGRATVAPEQAAISGTWTAEINREKAGDRIHFTFFRRNADGHMNNSGSSFALGDFQGLTRQQVSAVGNTPVSFRLAREAGTLACEGSFRDGRGVGDWRLIPSQSFRDAMNRRGYDNLTEQQMFSSVMINVTTKFIDDLKSAGFDRLSFEDVVKARIFEVTPQFVAEMKSLGFENLELEELVKARIFKVDAEFVRQVQSLGVGRQSLEGLVKLRIFEITPEFVREMKTVNFEDLSAEELVKLRIFKVTPEFIKALKAEGLSQISVEDAVKLRIHHVDEDFIRRARANGYTDLSVEELVRLSIHGKVK